jgi:hypothetical protein
VLEQLESKTIFNVTEPSASPTARPPGSSSASSAPAIDAEVDAKLRGSVAQRAYKFFTRLPKARRRAA